MRALLFASWLGLTFFVAAPRALAQAPAPAKPAPPASAEPAPLVSPSPAPPRAEAPPPQPTPAPYRPWTGSQPYAPPPPGPALPPPPLPAPPPPEYARRPIELIPELGLSLPVCASGSVSDQNCDGVRTGGGVGIQVLWRFIPYFAWGGGFEIEGFRYQPPSSLGLSGTSSAAVFLGLLGRAYFLDEGALDPYLQMGLGGGALGTSFKLDGASYQETGAGPAVQIGGGLDFFLSRRVKLGPSITWTRVFVDKLRRCGPNSSDCVDVQTDQQGELNSFVTLYARLTILLGDEL
jgi:hypothetical protein